MKALLGCEDMGSMMAGAETIKEQTGCNIAETADSPEFCQQIGQVSRQSSVYLGGRLFALAAGYFFKVYLARKLGAEALGDYALGLTIIGSLGLFNTFGLPRSATRFVSAYQATGQWRLLRGFLIRSLLILAVSSLVFVPALLLIGPLIASRVYHAPELNRYFGLFAALMGFGAVNTFLAQVLAGYKNVARATILTTFVSMPLMMGCSIALIAMGWGLRGYLLAQVIASACLLVLLGVAVWKQAPVESRARTAPVVNLEKRVISFSAVVIAMEVLGFLISHSDKILLGVFLNPRDVGIYALAAGIVALVPIILQSVNQIFSPVISDLHSRGERELLGRVFQTLTKWILGLTFPLAATVIVFARPLMGIFGPEFEAGWPVLVIGTLGQLVNCGVGSAGYLLLMSGNEKRLLRIEGAVAIMTVLLGGVFVYRMGIVGAALAAAVANILQNILYLKGVHERLHLFPYNRSYTRLALPFAVTVVALLFVSRFSFVSSWMELSVALMAAYAVFVATMLLSGLDADDRLITSAVWLRARRAFLPAEAA